MIIGRIVLALWLSAPVVAVAGDNPELRSIKQADQADRRTAHTPSHWRDVMQRDRERHSRVLEILKEGKLGTAWDYSNAALVLQHGDSAGDIRLAHSLSTVASTLDPEHRSAKWLMAASWDSLMLHLEQPQWYGTQSTRNSSGQFILHPIALNAVTDADRAALGVPPLAEAQARIDSRNEGK